MKLDTLFGPGKCPFALEVFPPKRHSKVESVYQTLERLGEIPVGYISVTYSAGGGGAKEYTGQIAAHLKNAMAIEPLAHLTCLYSGRDEIAGELAALRAGGVENILALRGDHMEGVPPKRDFAHASDLLAAIAAEDGFYTVAACYPEGHPESPNLAEDVDNLRRKREAGAGHFVSQLFFDNDKFFRFVEKARAAGMHAPIEAGVMPIVKPEQIQRTVSLSSASLPSDFTRWVSRWTGDPDAFYRAGVAYAITQIRGLIEGGADGIHLYAMNNPDVAKQVYAGVADLLPAPRPEVTDAF